MRSSPAPSSVWPLPQGGRSGWIAPPPRVDRSSRLHATVTAQECARALISLCSRGARVRAQPATGLEVEESGRTTLLELGERWRWAGRRAKFHSLKLRCFGLKNSVRNTMECLGGEGFTKLLTFLRRCVRRQCCFSPDRT